jgi:5-methylcytosine-specific restriction endonuclease McrA
MSGMHVPRRLRDSVRRRAGGLCEYCRYPDEAFYAAYNCEHCVPGIAGGPTNRSNLAWACPACNSHKALARTAPDPATGRRVVLFNPRRDSWSEHFRWSDDLCRIVGITPKGRATVERLQMNRPRAVYVRALLLRAGHHPAAPR